MLARPAHLLVALLALLALGGCGLRLETPPPAEPSPDAAEQVRARTAEDALDLVAVASAARPGAPDPVAAVLDDVVRFSGAHARELGGHYDSGLPEPTPTGPPTPTTVPAVAPVEVWAGLRRAAATAIDDAEAEAEADPNMARLLAAVGVARAELAARLADALADGVPQPEPTPAPEVTSRAEPTGVPDGLTADDVRTLALVHDQAGYGLEVVAAKLDGDARATAVAAAARHRAAAARWALRGGFADAETDPRRPVYALPADIDDPVAAAALAADLETAVAQAASAPLVHAVPTARGELLGELEAATAAARGWGAPPTAFPGLPDLTA